jgi:CDP-glycerol glycerophosphotransferase (TagB/SpsB family)
MRFMQLPKEQRRLTFYSEGKNYWVHLKGLIREMLATSDIPICYISSGYDDPGLLLQHDNYHVFKINEGFVRNWLFENIETDVMVMTMPDLHQYQVKRSKHKVHYVYVQHSLVSLHMAYRKGAFDYFDTILCAGPHHVKEIRAMEKKYNQPSKNLVEHGYGRLDAIIKEANKRPKKRKTDSAFKHVLIAPSWGVEGIIESGIAQTIVNQLLEQGHQVTLRSHPQTIRFAKNKIDLILNKYIKNNMFNYEASVSGQDSLHDSDFMISDWSGAALDYSLGLGKPVIFIDVPRKVNNPDYCEIDIEPIEVFIREEIGNVVKLEDVANLSQAIEKVTQAKLNENTVSTHVFNQQQSAIYGSKAIKKLL